MVLLREVPPDRPCDRCGHESRFHGAGVDGSDCRVARKAPGSGPRAVKCFCDGYFPAAVRRSA